MRKTIQTKEEAIDTVQKKNLAYELGEEYVSDLEKLARTAVKADTAFYKKIADDFRVKVNELQESMKVKIW